MLLNSKPKRAIEPELVRQFHDVSERRETGARRDDQTRPT